VGVCSSLIFLIHKWIENFPRFPYRQGPAHGTPGLCARVNSHVNMPHVNMPHVNMEIKQRMSKRFAWLLGIAVLVSIGLLVACGTSYHSTSDGLVIVGSQGSALLQTFSFDLDNGGISSVYNSTAGTGSETCVLPGQPEAIILDPAGAYAYAILNSATSTLCQNTVTGIQAFKVNSDGTLTIVGSLVSDYSPVAMAMDSAGKLRVWGCQRRQRAGA